MQGMSQAGRPAATETLRQWMTVEIEVISFSHYCIVHSYTIHELIGEFFHSSRESELCLVWIISQKVIVRAL